MTHRPTVKEIERGPHDMKTLERWGVPWPPPKGWKKRLLAQAREGTPAASPSAPPKPRRGGPEAFPAEWSSSCSWCPDTIEVGDMITGRREHGWVHVECAAAIDAMR